MTVKMNVKDAMEKLTLALATIKTDEDYKDYLRKQAKFYRYSPRNMSLIFWQKPDATYVAGFNTWKSLGRMVRKGEKGLSILAPIPLKDDEGKKSGIFFRLTSVFDVSQTDAVKDDAFDPEKDLTWKVRGESDMLPILESVINADGATIQYTTTRDGEAGSYSPTRKAIRIVKANTACMANVLVHEWAHHRVHGDGKTYTYAEEEVIVESITYIVSQVFGIQSDNEKSSFVYITGWMRDDEKSFVKALGVIQKEARAMIELIEKGGEHATA